MILDVGPKAPTKKILAPTPQKGYETERKCGYG